MTVTTVPAPRTTFTLPPGVEATAPAERRGVARDGVRLLVARPDGLRHTTFGHLADHLEAGDLVVVNTSATLPAAVDGRTGDGARVPVHVAAGLDDGSWVIELRRPDNSGPLTSVSAGDVVALAGGVDATIVSSFPAPDLAGSRLWKVRTVPATDRLRYLRDHGRPIRYGYLTGRWPLGDLQNVYADEPGSAEMPSAGRPFTHRLMVQLVSRGVVLAPLVLHTGVSSPEKHEPPMPEPFAVPESTARLVNSTRDAGGRVVAVGTTVARALESAADSDGTVRAAAGWTDLVLGPQQPARVVSGLVSGLHEPEASHLLLLEAVAGGGLVSAAYREAVSERYLWHEFGDSMLLLP